MFCFCLQSSLLKLQALEVEGGPSLGPSPEESPPALGSKEQKSPCGPVELGEKDGKTLALCHSVPADENSPPGTCTCSACLSVFLSACLSACLPACLPVFLPVCLPVQHKINMITCSQRVVL